MRFHLSKDTLALSQNAGIQELAAHDFLYNAEDFKEDYEPARSLYFDIVRGAQINGFSNQNPQFHEQIEDVSDKTLLALIQNTFPALSEAEGIQEQKKILRYWDRGAGELPAFLSQEYPHDKPFQEAVLDIRKNRYQRLTAVLREQFPGADQGHSYADLILKYYSQNPQYPSVSPFLVIAGLKGLGVEALKQSITLRSVVEAGRYKVYYEINVPMMTVTNLHTDEKIEIKGSKWKFELTAKGFEFVDAFAYSKNVFDMLMGAMPDNLKWFKSYPLSMRIKDAYARAPITRPLKFIGEFLPHLFESLADWAADYLHEKMPNQSVIKNTPLRLMARGLTYLAIGLLDVVSVAAKCARLLISRVTSPVRSYREARELHPALGVLSALVSASAIIVLGVFASPIMSFLGLNSAAAWLVAHTGPVGAFLQTAGAKIAGAFGEAVSSAMAGVMCFAAAVFSLAFLPLATYFESKRVPVAQQFKQEDIVIVPEEPDEDNSPPESPLVHSAGHTSQIADALQSQRQDNSHLHESALGEESKIEPVVDSPRSVRSNSDRQDEQKTPTEQDVLVSDNQSPPSPRSLP
ncbi:MAG: hypothetical protein P4M14_09565 [Gammaproteobacteria bacterium]|nr:hypothetical protein [Gammaproteobacteria bacterium]